MLCVCAFRTCFLLLDQLYIFIFLFDCEVNDGSLTFFTGQDESFTRQGEHRDERLQVCLPFVISYVSSLLLKISF